MRQRLTIILTFVVIIGVLAIINTLTFVEREKIQDTEIAPNRSTYHSGPTGTRALHDFLSESGYKVMRWRESTDKLLSDTGRNVATFVVIGDTQLPFSNEQAKALTEWVARGGCYVLIHREPEMERPEKPGDWNITAKRTEFPGLDVDPANVSQMTENITPIAPVQPTRLTHNIATVLPSRFASRFEIAPVEKPPVAKGAADERGGVGFKDQEEDAKDAPVAEPYELKPVSFAPVVHIADRNGALLVDYAFGRGRVILLADPYMVTNAGIRSNDNLQLAINVLTGQGGLIAFDEYHQGRGVTRNAFASYFSGTPVLAVAAQIVFVVLLILWTNARRFGRPLPLAHVDRRSSLEFVASMSELQERSRAFDLAIENIYSRTRRVLARYAGVNYNSSRSEIASRIAARSTMDVQQLETLMRQCEDVINGQQIHWQQAVDLVRRLRELERKLGLRMRSRDVRQAAEHI